MIARYGSHAHEVYELGLTTEEDALRSPQDVAYAVRRRLHVTGKLVADTQSQLFTKIARMRAAYSKDGKDFTLFTPSGSTKIPSHSLVSRDTLGGVRVVKRPSFTEYRGAELGLYATYALILEGDFPEPGNTLLFSAETVTITGTGGPIWRHRRVINGRWPRDLVNTHSSIRVVQQGEAVGHSSYPAPKPPLLPRQFEHEEERDLQRADPERHGSGFSTYRISWRYIFEQG